MHASGKVLENKAFDEKIFKKYQHAKVSVLSTIRPDIRCLIKNKAEFFNGDITHPTFTYKKNTRYNYDASEALLHELVQDIKGDTDVPHTIKDQYYLVIEEKLTKINLLRQTQALALTKDEEQPMQLFLKYSEQLYGTVHPEIFLKVIQTVERDILRKVHSPKFNAVQTPSFERLTALFLNYKTCNPGYTSLQVTPKIIIPKAPAITEAGELKVIFEKGLVDYGITDMWSVVIDSKGTRSTVSVSYDLHKIYLPSTEQLVKRSKRKRLTQARVSGLIAHEIGTHVVRKINGEESLLKLLSVGLCKYEQGEEGLATFREQQAQSLQGYSGLEAYLAIGLAMGSDGAPARDFSQVHAILTDYFLIVENTTMIQAKELAWNRCVRIFRGTSGKVPGVVFTKDLLYRHGNINHWNAVKNNALPNINLDCGKFDPTNQEQVHFLQSIGVR